MQNQLKQIVVVLITGLLLSCGVVNAAENAKKGVDKPLLFYTEIAPPYFSLDSENQPQGAMYDLAMALMEQTQMNGRVQHLPWARAYFEAKDGANIVLLTALRSSQRENQLQWLGVVHSTQAQLIARKNDKPVKLADLQDAQKFVVGSIRGYGSANYLISNGFVEGYNLKLFSSQEQLWSMLFKGRIDLVLDNLTTGKFEALKAGFAQDDVESVLKIDVLDADLEMATGHLTDAKVAKILQQGLQTLKGNGTYEQIMSRWQLIN